MLCVGEPSSYVHGSIIDGIFSGRIDLVGDTFYIDKAELYFSELQPFHSIIYSDQDVVGKPKRLIIAMIYIWLEIVL